MNLRSLAARNVWRNRGRYLAYLGSAAFSVMIYFLYTSLAHHPYFAGGYRGATYVVKGIQGASVVIAVFTLLFLLYSGAAFVRSRMKEFGLLTLLGLSRAQLVWVVLWENVFIAVSAIGIGLGLGLLFLKLFFMVISLVLRLPQELPLYTAWPVWRQTLLVFGGSFLLVSLLSLYGVLRRNIIELIRADRQPLETPRFSAWKAFVGVLLVGGGYAWASSSNAVIVSIGVLPVTLMVTIGTYFVTRELSIAVLRWLHRRDTFFYRPRPFLTVSRLTFKLQDNYRVLSAVAVLVAVILSAVGTIFAFYVVTEEDARMNNPQAMQLVLPVDADVEAEAAKVRAIVEGHGVDDLAEHVVRLPSAVLFRGKQMTTVTLFPYSLYADLYRPEGNLIAIDGETEAVLVHGYMPMLMEKSDETVFTGRLENSSGTAERAGSGEGVPGTPATDLGGLELSVKPDVSGKMLNGFDVGFDTLVLQDAVYERWVAARPEAEHVPVVVWTGANWRGPGVREAVEELRALYPWAGEAADEAHFSATVEAYEELVSDFGLALFIGIFVSLVFFAASCSLLYFRLFTELDEDRRYYTRLQQLGLGAGELRRLAATQAVVVFFVPFLFGLLHSAFAMRALGTLMMRSVLHFGGIVALAYLVPYTVYFAATFGLYWRTLRLGAGSAGPTMGAGAAS